MYALILTIILGPVETGPIHEFVVHEHMTLDECFSALVYHSPMWATNDSIGMHCEEEV